ncbi:hypothetical protein [Paenisporosarcina sp. TG20]|uniref:hypothetical protein n=1 Tax=Paenisporosarcina sp. TG20 TaxID=1211706 RepID=UPI0002ED7BD4|nr:hypothetical protein [Paenisporosarcina sp. TG20]
MNYNGYRQNWHPVLTLLNQSLFAEQMVCSISTQLFHIDATKDLEGNVEMHNHLVPASYHRVTALGAANRLQNGESHDSVIQTMISCINNALKEDQGITKWLPVMLEDAPDDYKPFIQSISNWQQQKEQTLLSAQQHLTQMGYEVNTQNQY